MRAALGVGLAFKPEHFHQAASEMRDGQWWEIHPENYQVAGGPRWRMLQELRERHPLSLHGVSLSLASPETVHGQRLAALCDLSQRLQPTLISEHLAWSWWRGVHAPDLLPAIRSTFLLEHLVQQIERVQTALGRTIALENPSHYVPLDHEWDEVDFLNELARRSGCMLLVDINNVAVSAHNLGLDAMGWLDGIEADRVAEIHLAGYDPDERLGDALWIDSHASTISDQVWSLYARFIDRVGPKPTLIERDENIPTYDSLQAEADRARDILAESVCPLRSHSQATMSH
jgi:uncharacterized protein (UPF0276 family)